jgi:osmotically-inducible protein OsmY
MRRGLKFPLTSSTLEKVMSDDKRLKQDVLAELAWDPSVNEAHIGVTARDGVVTLSGHVESYVEKRAAEKATGRVRGVKAVAEGIEVRLPSGIKRGDDEIAAAALDRLAWNVSIPHGTIKVTVEKGLITLTGEVDWHYQREAAEQDVRGLSGVVGVSNQATIKARVDVSGVSDAITHALHRSWFFDPETIAVTAEGGKVRLSGAVPSWHDREIASDFAWAAPGVTGVENDIFVR